MSQLPPPQEIRTITIQEAQAEAPECFPRTPMVLAYDLQRQVKELQEQRDKLLGATKYALKVIAEYNAGGTIETQRQMRTAQQQLFNAVKDADPEYFGLKKTGSITR